MDLDLSGKSALVSGSTKGIGLATAKGLAAMGAEVVINGRSEASIEKAKTAVLALTPDAKLSGVVADLSTAEGCDVLIAAVPSVDVLVNNMGIDTLTETAVRVRLRSDLSRKPTLTPDSKPFGPERLKDAAG